MGSTRPIGPLTAILGLILVPAAASGQGMIIIDPRPPVRPVLAPPLPLPGVELKSHQVTVAISDQVATTTVEHVFYNPGGQTLEGTFLFPLSKSAHLEQFTMDVNGKMTEAELLDADKARQIYEDIVRRVKDPGLLEYCNHQLLKTRIFPIEPHSEKRVNLRYTHLLGNDAGLIAYHYPLTKRSVNNRPVGLLSLRVELKTTAPLANVYSPSHTVEVNRDGRHKAVVGFESNQIGDTDLQLYFSTERPKPDARIALSLLTYRDKNPGPSGTDNGYFMLLASPGSLATDDQPLPKDIIFVIDTSGSMEGKKLEQARRALRFCLSNLNAEDRFEIIRFSTDVEPVFGKLVSATAENIEQARTMVDRFKPIGGTTIHGALQEALSMAAAGPDDSRPRSVIFLTDGRPTIGETSEQAIVDGVQTHGNKGSARVFCFGIGTDINTHLLDKITERTRAFSQYLLPEEDIEVKISSFYTRIANPVLTNVRLTTDGPVRLSRIYPTALPDLFMGDQLVVFGRYAGAGDTDLVISGVVRDEKSETITVNAGFSPDATEHGFIPRLWAMRRVGFLLDEIRLRGENTELRDEVVQLARAYGIVTPYTAYLIVEDEEQRAVPLTRRSLQIIQQDAELRDRARLSYVGMRTANYGRAAVGGARSNRMLRSAVAAPVQEAAAKAATMDAVLGMQRAPIQRSRYIAGRAFVQNGPQWIDTLAQDHDAPTVQITFNSDEYFQLLRDHPEAAPWLSLGRSLQVVIGRTLYEVLE